MVVSGWTLTPDSLVQVPGAKAVFRIEQTSDHQHSRLNIVHRYPGITRLPPLVEIGVLIDVFPEGDTVPGQLHDILKGARLQVPLIIVFGTGGISLRAHRGRLGPGFAERGIE